MLLACKRSASTTSLWLSAAIVLAMTAFATDSRAQGVCDAAEVSVLPSPVAPWKGAPLRIVVAAEKPVDGELSLIAPDGSVAARTRQRYAGPPYVWFAEVAAPAAGTWRVNLAIERGPAGCSSVTRDIAVRDTQPPKPGPVAGMLWPVRASWNRATENLFAAWIEKLFDAPLDASLSWPALHEGLRDRSRNFLHNHLGLGEDDMNQVIRPDCADLPYFLRAYFAFKIGLPFGFSKCNRGGAGRAPTCGEWTSIQGAQPAAPGLAASFHQYLRGRVADTVHSGSGRTNANDNNNDYYPVSLTQETLRPGVVYHDPYGHVLMITKRVPQTEGGAGVFLAVDGQPDGTVARKRFWRGNFLFANGPGLGGPGFKRFRPIVSSGGALRRLTNEEIAKHPQYGDFSLEQSRMTVEEFYDRMDDVMSPSPLDPLAAMKEAIASLEEQVKTRVTSVENGRKFQNSGKGEATMPDGPAIFETIGAWEDFSTPARDLRILIAIDVVRNFPERVARRPERYAMPTGRSVADVKAELQSVLASELTSRKFTYPRSNGSPWTLALKDVIDRATDLEMAYNPNDCVEIRWGAPAKSEEVATCKRYAPQAQRAKMVKYRAWFRERRRPARA